jgi:plastocyanin
VNAGLAAAQGLAANAAEPPALAKLPLLLPQGPGDAPQVAANPCFIASGDLPANLAAPCPVRRATPFTGKEPFYNSGFLANGTDFSVKLASTVAPGKYSFFCLLHRAAMSGAITVVPASQTVPAPSEVTASGKAAQKTITDQLKAAVTAEGATQLPGGKESLPEPGAVAEGIGTQSVTNALADVFVPTTISIPVGNTVTWKVTGAHNLTFNPPDDARLGLVKAPDGTFHANAKAFAPAAGPGAPDNAPPGTPVVIDGGSFDGTGFHSSGIMLAFGPPGSYSYKLTFTKAGSYSFECTIHPKMAGTVKVG